MASENLQHTSPARSPLRSYDYAEKKCGVAPSLHSLHLDYNEYAGAIMPSTLHCYDKAKEQLPRYYRAGDKTLEKLLLSSFNICPPTSDAAERQQLASKVCLVPGADDGIFRWLLINKLSGAKTLASYHPHTYDHALIFASQLGYEIVPFGEKADLLYLCTPNNPDGATTKPQELLVIANAFPGKILVDLSYAAFSEIAIHEYTQNLDKQANCSIVASGAKMFPLAGVRFGWILSFDPAFLNAAQNHINPKLVPPIARELAENCLENFDYYAKQTLTIFRNRARTAEVLVEFLLRNNVELKADLSGAGNFFRLHGSNTSLTRSLLLLEERKVVLRGKSHWPFLRATSLGDALLDLLKFRLAEEPHAQVTH